MVAQRLRSPGRFPARCKQCAAVEPRSVHLDEGRNNE